MKTLAFASRNTKEMVRDKITLLFRPRSPLILLFFLSLMQANIPTISLRRISDARYRRLRLFLHFSLFRNDRSKGSGPFFYAESVYLTDDIGKLHHRVHDPLLPYGLPNHHLLSCRTCLGTRFHHRHLCRYGSAAALLHHLHPEWDCSAAPSLQKSRSAVSGALLTNLTAWLSGTWFRHQFCGERLYTINHLPFCHAVDAGRAALSRRLRLHHARIYLWVFALCRGHHRAGNRGISEKKNRSR